MESAKKLLGFSFNADAFARRAPQSSKPNQQNLDVLAEIVNKHGDADHKSPDREDRHQIYRIFTQASQNGKLRQEFNTAKRIRQLSWALTFSENKQPRIVDTPQLQDALQLIENRFRTSSLFGVFNALMQAWDTPNADMLRAFVKKHLKDYNGSRKFAQELKANKDWYCEKDSASKLAEALSKLSDVWSFLDLPDYMHTYPYFGAVAKSFVSRNKNINRDVLADVSNFLERHNNDKTSRSILSKLIEKLGLDASENFRAPVQSYVLRKWQDPRIAGADVRWRGVSPKARQIFTKWLTEADLEFFFDIVAKACNDQKFAYRKAFWFAYLEHITFCRPVLRKNVENLFIDDPEALKFYRERHPATLTGGTRNQHAFIIQMGSFTFIEFSTSGACYIYLNSDLPFELGNSTYDMSELRNQLWAEHRVNHINSEKYSWQGRLESWINNSLGIEPIRSYQLAQ